MGLDIDLQSFSDNFQKYTHIKSNLLLKPKSLSVNNYKYSITIPTFKRPKLLLEAIESCINQDYDKDNWQIVIVDNNPEDDTDTTNVINKIGSMGNVFYYKNEQNIGMFGNWNRCIELASGEFVTILSDDDLLKPNFLSEMDKQIIKMPELNMIFGAYDFLKSGKIIRDNTIGFKNKMYNYIFYGKSREINLIDYFLRTFGFSASALVFRRTLALELGGHDDLAFPSADYLFQSKFVMNFGNAFFLYKHLAIYRIENNESMKYEVCEQMSDSHFQIKKKMIQFLPYSSNLLMKLAVLNYKNDIYSIKNIWNHDFTYKLDANSAFFKQSVYLKIYLNLVQSWLRKKRTLSFFYK
jgi:glycosyltransferase involved in cell wall biosynthesis